MASVFDALPGLDASVGAIGKGLAEMWGDTAAHGRAAPSTEDSKATQVNFVLHFGFNTTPEDALAQFQIAVNFSRRYPSRVVVLCPLRDEIGPAQMRAKVYGECTLGRTKDDTRCCEFVILSHPPSLRRYLENQVSVCLSTDLPLYYWPHRFADTARLADYHYLLTRSKRVLIDSATAAEDTLAYPWPKPEAVRDLAVARLLPVRQSVGQFLSRYPMPALCGGLQTVTVAHGTALDAEARVLLEWARDRIGKCGENRANFVRTSPAPLAPGALELTFTYDGAKTFSWKGDVASGAALFEADFGTGRTRLPAAVSLLSPENALSEAMFF
jgi:glucose-6-phosphate dehydrogenase assembly protein OpcA